MARIPNVFHFVFGLKPQTEPFHLVHYLCIASCIRTNRPARVFLYHHHEPFGRYWELVRPHLTLVRVPLDAWVRDFRYADAGIDPYRYAHHSDFIRLERLLDAGGIYADIDTIFVNPLPAELREHSFVLGSEGEIVPSGSTKPVPSLGNAFIMAEPNAEFGRRWLAEMRGAFDGSWSNHSTLLPQRLSERWPELVHVEPPRTFYKHSFTPEGIRTLFEALDEDFTGVVSFHLWSHLWWSRWRRDFSTFHAGRLTERTLARAETTYARVAREHLPPPASFAVRTRAAVGETLERMRRRLRR
jgi:hypothetical protein